MYTGCLNTAAAETTAGPQVTATVGSAVSADVHHVQDWILLIGHIRGRFTPRIGGTILFFMNFKSRCGV